MDICEIENKKRRSAGLPPLASSMGTKNQNKGNRYKHKRNYLRLTIKENPYKENTKKYKCVKIFLEAENCSMTHEEYMSKGGRSSALRSLIKYGIIKADAVDTNNVN